MERVCFFGRVRPGRLDEYRERHEHVWPDLLAALRRAGFGNYSLFLTDDGLVVGYLETDDYQAALARMAETEVNRRWQEDMAPYFAELDGRHPDQAFLRIAEIFHLD
ncbi:MAG TPA: L-rhamnose mutarotase [Streptosporangiaceae bacterium]